CLLVLPDLLSAGIGCRVVEADAFLSLCAAGTAESALRIRTTDHVIFVDAHIFVRIARVAGFRLLGFQVPPGAAFADTLHFALECLTGASAGVTLFCA